MVGARVAEVVSDPLTIDLFYINLFAWLFRKKPFLLGFFLKSQSLDHLMFFQILHDRPHKVNDESSRVKHFKRAE